MLISLNNNAILEVIHHLSLQKTTAITNNEYLQILKDCGFVGEKKGWYCVPVQFLITPFHNFVKT
jgi:hypothetical protein